MDTKTAAAHMDGREYGDTEPKDLFAEMHEHGLVAFFGCSDDLIEMRGAIHDEAGEGEVMLTSSGLLTNDCEDSDCPYFAQLKRYASKIRGDFGQNGWDFTTDIPHERFEILEDGHRYGGGIVICLDDVP